MSKAQVNLAALILLTACLSAPVRNRSPLEQARDEDMAARNLVDGPARFVAVEASGSDTTLIARGTVCPRVLTDPRTGTRVQLFRVLPVGRGDYVLSAEQTYGAKPSEVLRIHCANGTPAGLVSR